MKNTNYRKTQARQFLKYEKLTEITDISDFANFYKRVYYIIAKYGNTTTLSNSDNLNA